MSKGNRSDLSKEPKDGENKRLKGIIKKLEHEISRLKSELRTYDKAFHANVTFLKTKTTQYSVEELIKGAEVSMTLEEIGKNKDQSISTLVNKWKCFKCDEGFLKIIIVPGNRYFRKCNCCENRTSVKELTEDVEGI